MIYEATEVLIAAVDFTVDGVATKAGDRVLYYPVPPPPSRAYYDGDEGFAPLPARNRHERRAQAKLAR